MNKSLSIKEQLFVAEVVSTGDAIAACRHVYNVDRYSDDAVARHAEKVANRPHVKAAIEAGRRVLGEKLIFDVKDVFLEWMDIATADPNELVSLHKENCRHCWGVDHHYQWTEREYTDACLRHIEEQSPTPPPDAKGGFDFDLTRAPNPACPECRGRGVANIQLHDTTKLSRKARKLYAGVKYGKYGIEILMRDQDAALANIAKSLGMFVERIKLETTVHEALTKPLPTDPVEASRYYMELIANDDE